MEYSLAIFWVRHFLAILKKKKKEMIEVNEDFVKLEIRASSQKNSWRQKIPAFSFFLEILPLKNSLIWPAKFSLEKFEAQEESYNIIISFLD